MQTSAVLLTVDCLRADHVGVYGYERDTTPTIDELASDGTHVERAYSNGPGTRFAFKSLNGGVYPLRIEGAGLPARQGTTIAERLSADGYRTAAFANNPFLTSYFNYDRGYDVFEDVSHWSDTDEGSERALARLNRIAARISERLGEGRLYRSLKAGYSRFIRAAEAQGARVGTTDADVVDEAINWIRNAEASGDPYFAWIHFMGAHHPYRYLPEQREILGIPDDVEHIRNPTDLVHPGRDPDQAIIDAYDANIRAVDSQIDRLRGYIGDETTIVLTGDHGEEFGQHNAFHNASVYDTMARVPLVVAGPAATNVDPSEPACHVDIPFTLASGSDSGAATGWDGTDLTKSTSGRDRLHLGFETPESITGAVVEYPWKYVCEMADQTTVRREELYDTAEDPSETDDRSTGGADKLSQLGDEWQSHLENVLNNRMHSEHEMWDAERDLRDTVNQAESDGTERELEERLEYLGYK